MLMMVIEMMLVAVMVIAGNSLLTTALGLAWDWLLYLVHCTADAEPSSPNSGVSLRT